MVLKDISTELAVILIAKVKEEKGELAAQKAKNLIVKAAMQIVDKEQSQWT